MTTYSQKARIWEDRKAKELDNLLTDRDAEDMEYRSCPIGPGECCRTCKMRLECEE